MTAPVVFLDTETTGLDPEIHEVWEIAVIRDGAEHVFHVRPQKPAVADSTALRITRFYERQSLTWLSPATVAVEVAMLTAGRHLVAAVPSFDAAFLRRFLVANGQAPAWHYHLVDVEAMAAGKLGWAPPWDSEELSVAAGVEPPSEEDRHTALGDARWARAVYEAVLTPPPDPRP